MTPATSSSCNACGSPKPFDRFKACPTCREQWRKERRKPGGYVETIEQLQEEIRRLNREIARLQDEAARP